ncbi:unnamed protein product [Miscanthus lutarioriparius]|uniref:Uncharacterized protein n=1 Tax=Miscanthus lutarioriparius TaxID=422564 RepID=A0A811RBV2_9POAL|nr:unnamed protein product [Miscanthus lutarioriparius]
MPACRAVSPGRHSASAAAARQRRAPSSRRAALPGHAARLRETGADREPDAVPPGRPGCGTATNALRRTATFEGPQPARPHPPPQAFHDDHRFAEEEGKQVAPCASSPGGAPHRPCRIPALRRLCRGLALPSGGRRGLDGSAGLAPPATGNCSSNAM